MLRSAIPLTLLFAALPVFAFDTDGWDVFVETQHRSWRQSSAQWAGAIHPSNPTPSSVVRQVSPPPREMWCVDPAEWPQYCAAWNHSMEQWLHHFLDIPYGDALPADLPAFPKECASPCSAF